MPGRQTARWHRWSATAGRPPGQLARQPDRFGTYVVRIVNLGQERNSESIIAARVQQMLTMVQHQRSASIIDDTDERVDRRTGKPRHSASRDGHAVSVDDRNRSRNPNGHEVIHVVNLAPICSARQDFPIPSIGVTGRLDGSLRDRSALRPTKLIEVAASGMLDGGDLWHHDHWRSVAERMACLAGPSRPTGHPPAGISRPSHATPRFATLLLKTDLGTS